MAKGRPKGSPKPPGSGRKPGSTNIAVPAPVIKESILEAFHRHNFDPIQELAQLIPKLAPEARAKTLVSILPYVAVPLKAPETPQQPAFQVFANVDRAALLQAVNAPQVEEDLND